MAKRLDMKAQEAQVVTFRRLPEVQAEVLFGLLLQGQQSSTTQPSLLTVIGVASTTMIKMVLVVVQVALSKSPLSI